MSIPFLDFYGERQIIPVRQNINALGMHFRKRRALYRQLGLPSAAFKGKRIIEFGPGSGDDAVHTASLAPSRYILVDGNPASVRAVREKIADGRLIAPEIECRESEILGYRDAKKYDLVIAEGIVPGQSDPAAFLRHIAGFVDEGGAIFCTLHSATSILAEVCRRMVKPIFARRHSDFDMCLGEMTHFFSPDLNSLHGMTRLHEDWVLDTILHPWRSSVVFTIADAITALGAQFEVLGTSPHFEQDWRWYKTVGEDPRSINDHVLDQLDKWAACLIDYRQEPEGLPGISSSALEAHCRDLYYRHIEIWDRDDVEAIPEWLEQLLAIRDQIAQPFPHTAASITDFAAAMARMIDGETAPDFGHFTNWFGRGLQYVSMVRAENTAEV
jgi:ubiquinone/menaquinone biosynthesis C-methylase UbiE